MNHDPDLLTEMLDIIIEHLLYDSAFCGSVAGRRLNALRRRLIGPQPSTSSTAELAPLVNRTLALPIDLDNALTVAVAQSGMTRDVLIAGAIAAMIAEQRLV